MVTEFGGAIAAGEVEVALILGSEPGSTAKYFADRDDKPDFTEQSTASSRTAATATSYMTSTPRRTG